MSSRRKHCWSFSTFTSLSFASLFLFIVVVFCTVALYRYEETISVSANDSRSNSFPAQYFSKLEIYYTDAVDHPQLITTNLYILEEIPPRTLRNSFTITDKFDIFGPDVLFWKFYLPVNSNFTLFGCLEVGDSFTLSIIKGNTNYSMWSISHDAKYVVDLTHFFNNCSETKRFQYSNSQEDTFYFAYYTDQTTTAQKICINQSFQRFQFSRNDLVENSITNCTIQYDSSCKVIVPSAQWNKWVITTGSSDWDDTKTQYNLKINGLPSLPIIGAIVSIALVLGCCQLVCMFTAICTGIHSYFSKSSDPISRNSKNYYTIINNPVFDTEL